MTYADEGVVVVRCSVGPPVSASCLVTVPPVVLLETIIDGAKAYPGALKLDEHSNKATEPQKLDILTGRSSPSICALAVERVAPSVVSVVGMS